ncbi:hypothetical protein A4X09_0g4444 [Tilletia walkeri]|uniref:Uncharacterized protein n=1 Tax=Tilletia walkeri TaxID=117179 RepID=A0A8X7T4A1_9BASI|nr:hypothetical protein A4X09_0g4444 [Tilletia walkeri]
MQLKLFILLLGLSSLAHVAANAHGLRPIGAGHASLSIKRQEPQPGQTLYVNAPACDYFQCSVKFKTGDLVAVNWINAPRSGNVQVSLMTHNSEKLAHKLTTAPPKMPHKFCDSDEGFGVAVKGRTCGRVEFKMPSLVGTGNYTVRVNSLPPAPYQEEYTDVVLVKKTKDDIAFRLLTIRGVDGSIHTPTGKGYPSSLSKAD